MKIVRKNETNKFKNSDQYTAIDIFMPCTPAWNSEQHRLVK